ncbi:hypothetical protein Lal_00030099 [Lupinus albus]|nr:hypothetical protein Lal_00030099 [Lupinus albus]
MYQEDYITIVDLDLSDKVNPTVVPEQHPDATLAEASKAPQAPPFGVDADIQRETENIKNEID